MHFLPWVYQNLGEGMETTDGLWATTFAIATWWAWKWRCEDVFGGNHLWRDRVRFIKKRFKESSRQT